VATPVAEAIARLAVKGKRHRGQEFASGLPNVELSKLNDLLHHNSALFFHSGDEFGQRHLLF
jgi:hypothetical protein